MKKISVIIPVYNVEMYINQCLDSILKQSYKNFEVILVDDGSPDNCGRICDSYAEIDSRVKVIHKKNGGAPAARNDAMRICTGEWIIFIDPDDWVELNEFEEIMKVANRDDPDIIIFNTYINTDKDQIKKQAFPKEFVTTDRELIYGMQLSALHTGYTPMLQDWTQGFPWDKAFKASLLLENRIFWPVHLKANDDVVFNINAFQFANKIAYIDETLYHWRINPSSIGHKYTPDRISIDKEIYKEIERMKELYQFDERYEKAYYARVLSNMWANAGRCYFHPLNSKPFRLKIHELHNALKEEPIFTAFEKVDRSKLKGGEKVIAIFRHNNAVWIYLTYLAKTIINNIG